MMIASTSARNNLLASNRKVKRRNMSPELFFQERRGGSPRTGEKQRRGRSPDNVEDFVGIASIPSELLVTLREVVRDTDTSALRQLEPRRIRELIGRLSIIFAITSPSKSELFNHGIHVHLPGRETVNMRQLPADIGGCTCTAGIATPWRRAPALLTESAGTSAPSDVIFCF